MEIIAQITRLFDPLALAIVFGGAAAAGLMRGGGRALSAALASLRPLMTADPEADALAAIVAIGQVRAVVEARSVVCVDRIATTGRFMREALRHLADAPSSEIFARWAEDSLDARRARHATVVAFWRDGADAAPAMGLIATVLGLVAMFAHMDDPSRLGAPMASALVATLWGIVVANLIAGPIADRLERLSEAELAWQARTLGRLEALARAELDQAQGLQRHLARRFGT